MSISKSLAQQLSSVVITADSAVANTVVTCLTLDDIRGETPRCYSTDVLVRAQRNDRDLVGAARTEVEKARALQEAARNLSKQIAVLRRSLEHARRNHDWAEVTRLQAELEPLDEAVAESRAEAHARREAAYTDMNTRRKAIDRRAEILQNGSRLPVNAIEARAAAETADAIERRARQLAERAEQEKQARMERDRARTRAIEETNRLRAETPNVARPKPRPVRRGEPELRKLASDLGITFDAAVKIFGGVK
jgi:hypothetical protein